METIEKLTLLAGRMDRGANLRNHMQRLNSKRPRDLPVKEKRRENIGSIRTANPPKQT